VSIGGAARDVNHADPVAPKLMLGTACSRSGIAQVTDELAIGAEKDSHGIVNGPPSERGR
jgi:hypothetical protein